MKEIKAYRTEDGQIFEDPVLAEKHEQAVRIAALLRAFWNKYLIDEDMEGSSPEDAALVCIEHWEELMAILKIAQAEEQKRKRRRR